MLKKIGAALLCATLLPLPSLVTAETDCYISAIDGIDVTIKEADAADGVIGEFAVKNITERAVDVVITVTAEDTNNEVLAKATTVRRISAKKSAPLKFQSSAVSGEDVKLRVRVINLPGESEIYVSQNGSDTGDGSYSNPFRTLTRAIDSAKTRVGDASIVLSGGTYNVKEPVKINSLGNLSSLKLKTDGTEVVLSGGVNVKGADFTKVTDTVQLSFFPESVHGKLYSLDLTQYGVAKNTEDPMKTILYYNGEANRIAKYPNDGYSNTANVTWDDYGKRIMTFDSEDIKDWTNYGEAWVRGYFLWEWEMTATKVAQISDGKITFNPFNASSTDENARTDRPWYIYNLPAELDKEGEYILRNNVIYYYPPEADVADGSFLNSQIQLNTMTTDMLEIGADNVSVENITFENSRGYFVDVAADNVKVLGCTFKNNAAAAVRADGDNNIVSSCDFKNLGGNGVTMTGGDRQTLTSSGSVVKNCYFEKTGQISRTGASAIVLGGCGTAARNNTITQTPHHALGYSGNNLIIENNEFYNCMTDGTVDAGLIYTGNNLSNLGTKISGNYFHDSNSGLGAIYWDDFTSGQVAEGNVFENISNGVFIHGGVCNTVSGNIAKNTNYGVRVRGKGLYFTVDDEKYNSWDLIAGRYNFYKNVFMAQLEGGGNSYTAYPWQGDIWQGAYSDVLKYVGNRTDNAALEITVTNNTFSGMKISDNTKYDDCTVGGINVYAATEMSDLTTSGNKTEFDSESTEKYESVKAQSGIYADSYRKM